MIHDKALLSEDGAIVFELAVSTSAPEWPASVDGVKPVLSAVQMLLEAAAQGQSQCFDDARYDLMEAVSEWQESLFGKDDHA